MMTEATAEKVVKDFYAAIDRKVKTRGIKRSEAIRAVCREQPALHRRFLQAVNRARPNASVHQ